MRGGVEHLRIARKITAKDCQKIERLVRKIVGHGAVHTVEAQALFEVLIGYLTNYSLQQKESLGAMAALGQAQGMLRLCPCGPGGSLGGGLPIRI